MKKISLIIISLLILSCGGPDIVKPPSAVEHGWVVQAPELGIHKLFAVDFVDDNIGWIVGSGGTILHTTNGGISWEQQESHTDDLIYHIQFMDQLNGWYCTLPGSIYKTTDGGITWDIKYQEEDLSIYKIFFSDEKHGWACGGGKRDDTTASRAGVLLGTTDGGDTWFELMRSFEIGQSIQGVFFIDSLKGWATGNNTNGVSYTEDGGHTWQPLETISGSLSDMIFFNDTTGIAFARSAAVLKSYNSGLNWDRLPVISNGRFIYDMEFVGDQQGWLVGENGYINHTTDGGDSWNHQESGTNNILRSVSFTNQNNGWSVGYGGTVLHTIDGGANWNSKVQPTQKALGDISMVSKSTGCATGLQGTILTTTNGGTTWEKQNNANTQSIYGLATPSMNNWIAVGDSGTIIQSTNQGLSWNSIGPNLDNHYRDIFFLDENFGWIIGGKLNLKTTDGGNNWLIDSLSTEINSIYFVDSLVGWTTHRYGKIFKTTDGGNSWSEQFNIQDMFSFEDIIFLTDKHGFVVGQNISLFETKDGGTTWHFIYLGSDGLNHFNFVHFTDSLNGWIVGEDFTGLNGVIYKTTDGGATWNLTTKAVENPLYSVFAIDKNRVWICGENGTILHTTDGGSEF